LSELETLATLFACVIHDVDHPGFTNSYLINTGQSDYRVIGCIIVIVSKKHQVSKQVRLYTVCRNDVLNANDSSMALNVCILWLTGFVWSIFRKFLRRRRTAET